MTRFWIYIPVILSAIAFFLFLSGYFLVSEDVSSQTGGFLYITGLGWFYLGWVIAFGQVSYGIYTRRDNCLWKHHILSAFAVLSFEISVVAMGQQGLYLTA